MNWMNKLEKKWGRYAIPSLHKYLVIAIAIGYVLSYLGGDLINYLTFSASSILHGQIWRLVTWIFIPPAAGGVFFTMLFLLCLIPMGRSLESFFGPFKMNIYFIGGILLSDIGGLLVYLIFKMPVYLSTYHILFSLFLALALCMPDATVNLYFILPIKMKWMLLIYVAELAYEIVTYFQLGVSLGAWYFGFAYSTEIIIALLNLVLFFLSSRVRISRKHKKRQREFQAQMRQPRPGSGITKHKCAICGRTENDDPNLVFRYCSKCAGNYEYCQEHLFTHEHVMPK
ncbi:MAG: hypothetical protein J6B26_02220 [Agathobacter sp.]|nr:hypothetical protein [Agathobacter sp.]MBQ2282984.1 hypothetical protein [Agathobacter sp.]